MGQKNVPAVEGEIAENGLRTTRCYKIELLLKRMFTENL